MTDQTRQKASSPPDNSGQTEFCYSAPGKCILFGEHAVVYGKPAIAVTIDRRLFVKASISDSYKLNNRKLNLSKQTYIRYILDHYYNGVPLSIQTDSQLPSASGLGTSAALSTAMLAVVRAISGNDTPSDTDKKTIAYNGYQTEFGVQGAASPTDTTTVTAGGGIVITAGSPETMAGKDLAPLWDFEGGDKHWHMYRMALPPLTLVVGFTGLRGKTGEQVAKVRAFYDSNSFARDIIDEIGQLVLLGADALQRHDKHVLGKLMNRNHELLSILGVSHDRLEDLIKAVGPHSYGAKLTGAGGGGSMIALTDEPDAVAVAIKQRGGVPYIITLTSEGLRREDGFPRTP